ncbi:uncharacterized protein [Rutidosis leptorrhynchoides]|uniref:uncharacterized protein n=1 Tax=Rutidosis leptorrhynchoides TaxID=125765 RepID=UPI003A994460
MDEESEVEYVPRIPRVRTYIPRDRESAAERLFNDYFAEPPIFPAKKFKRRFRMRINLFLRIAQATDVARLYSAHEEKHGFRGMLGSINCMHWEWKNCPVAHKGQYTRGDHKKPTIMLEAVASYDLWI